MPKSKSKMGGRREGAGRPELVEGETLDKLICIRFTKEMKGAVEKYVEEKYKGKIDPATWLRELALKHSGNEHLGAVARAAAEQQNQASILADL